MHGPPKDRTDLQEDGQSSPRQRCGRTLAGKDKLMVVHQLPDNRPLVVGEWKGVMRENNYDGNDRQSEDGSLPFQYTSPAPKPLFLLRTSSWNSVTLLKTESTSPSSAHNRCLLEEITETTDSNGDAVQISVFHPIYLYNATGNNNKNSISKGGFN